MNMAKLAFATAGRVKDAAGVGRIPAMQEVVNEELITEAKEDSPSYTHFFRAPTRLQ